MWDVAAHNARTPLDRAALLADLRAFMGVAEPALVRPLTVLEARLCPEPGFREEALQGLLEKPEFADQRPRIHTALGDLLQERGSTAPAIAEFQQALRDQNTLPETWAGLARTLIDAGRPLDALDPLTRYLARRPHDATALYNQGWILLNLRQDPGAALPPLRAARTLLPNDVPTLLALASAALGIRPADTALASDVLSDALALAPDDPDVHWNLGLLAQDHTHDSAAALTHFRRYLEVGGTDRRRVTEWIRRLERAP